MTKINVVKLCDMPGCRDEEIQDGFCIDHLVDDYYEDMRCAWDHDTFYPGCNHSVDVEFNKHCPICGKNDYASFIRGNGMCYDCWRARTPEDSDDLPF